jgi:hypothetical protein
VVKPAAVGAPELDQYRDFRLRLPLPLAQKIEQRAQRERRSLNATITAQLERYAELEALGELTAVVAELAKIVKQMQLRDDVLRALLGKLST